MPNCGLSVVNGYAPTLAFARLMALRSVLLPAFGRPTSPTSAINFSSMSSRRSTANSPGVHSNGVCFSAPLKCSLPSPPMPPGATTAFWPGVIRSTKNSPVSASVTTEPTGNRISIPAPSAPWQLFCMPLPPSIAKKCERNENSIRVSRCGSATTTTSPPRPPLPPSGPPLGRSFSRRRCEAPSPPLPERTLMTAVSTKTFMV